MQWRKQNATAYTERLKQHYKNPALSNKRAKKVSKKLPKD
jgi:hypothetical protein